MGIENNEVVIATTWNDESIETAKEFISNISDDFRKLFCIIPSVVNGKYTVILGPDGSKKGWAISESGKALRDLFVKFLELHNHWEWVEVGYGEFGQKVLRGNCMNMYDDSDYCGKEMKETE